jgi:hypothetical protein
LSLIFTDKKKLSISVHESPLADCCNTSHVEEEVWKQWRVPATAEANHTTSGWNIEWPQTGDCFMQRPGRNMEANLFPFKSPTRVVVVST